VKKLVWIKDGIRCEMLGRAKSRTGELVREASEADYNYYAKSEDMAEWRKWLGAEITMVDE
jgi:hypothetical protein